MKETTLNPISQPEVLPGKIVKGEPFSYSAVVEVLPPIDLKDYHGFKLVRQEMVVSEEEVEHYLRQIQESMAQLSPTEDGALLANDMVATIDFKGTADGEEFDGCSASDFEIEIGKGTIIPELEEKLMGMKLGERRQISFSYPDDYFNVSLSGAQAEFEVFLKGLKRKILPNLDDDLAKSVGDYDSLDEVRKMIRDRLTEANEKNAMHGLRDQVLRKLTADNPIEVPMSMVGWELQNMLRQEEQRLKEDGHGDVEGRLNVEEFIEANHQLAYDRVRASLLLDEIAKREGIKVDADEIDVRLQELASESGRPLPEVRRFYEQRNLIPVLSDDMKREKALDLVVKESKIEIEKLKKNDDGQKMGE